MNFGLNLNEGWFFLLGTLFTGYAVLDGFDLGVGALHLLNKRDEERRIMINAIGPVWDGNEVWFITAGGALFAAFPHVYATIFSGFYALFISLLFVLIFRAVAIEFRSKKESRAWRNTWDVAFSISSIIIAFLMGMALGNVIVGIPLGPDKEFIGTFRQLLHPYALLVGITTVALFTMHGAIYVVMKTEGAMHQKIRRWINNTIIFFIICYVTLTMVTLIYLPYMADHFRKYPALFLVAFLNMLAIANIPREIHHGRDFRAFLSSAASIIALMALVGIGLFPNMVISNPSPENSLTIYNAASSQKTLSIMLIMVLIGIPFILAYTVSIYYIFRGKVTLDPSSY